MVLITIFIVVCGSIVEVDAIAVDNIAINFSTHSWCPKEWVHPRAPQLYPPVDHRSRDHPLNKLVDEAMSHSKVCDTRCVALPQLAMMEHVNNVFKGATFELLILMPHVIFTISKQVFYANKCGCARNIKHLNSRGQIVWSQIIL